MIKTAGAVAWVRDAAVPEENGAGLELSVTAHPALTAEPLRRHCSHETEWILLTSGTTGAPKLVLHTLASLTSIITSSAGAASRRASICRCWSTFYDIRRYGGLQIFLRAALAAAARSCYPIRKSPLPTFWRVPALAGITHISGTPSALAPGAR